ncbi:MAG: hypothetical protein WC522_07725 [Candidatus Omnitrophota bacterium]
MRLVSVLTVLILLCASYCQAESEDRALNSIEGAVSSTDWVGAVISVSGMRISVPSGAKISKGEDRVGLADINVGDQVTVTYYDNASGEHVAVRIVIQYRGDWAV